MNIYNSAQEFAVRDNDITENKRKFWLQHLLTSDRTGLAAHLFAKAVYGASSKCFLAAANDTQNETFNQNFGNLACC